MNVDSLSRVCEKCNAPMIHMKVPVTSKYKFDASMVKECVLVQ